ncbi:hypothetical protein POK33_38655 [Burkholderia cenocepacia]|uniref:hypothetical protein n=1 Tax=Burkholderia cenocepacia TaxID=95486 RepID=UPI0023B8AF04|nr:hypothetical protein [Burkholderia cenocepacia]MDF0506678.1 hypothetical protein [Burkholderia cenocepacia]
MNQQSSEIRKPRGRRPAASIDERIAEAERQLASLREQKKVEEKQSLERNRKAILDLFKSEGVDSISVDVWKGAMPKLKALLGLGVEAADAGRSAAAEAKASEQPA